MNRAEKEAVVSQLKTDLQQAQASFLLEYKGATVGMLQTLRRSLRPHDGAFKVAKARLMKIAAQEVDGANDFASNFEGQVGLVFAKGDVTAVAKELVSFAKENDVVEVLSGFYESKALSKEQVAYFATLPSREVLLGQLAGTLQAPIATFVRLLAQLICRLLYVLKAIAEKQEGAAA